MVVVVAAVEIVGKSQWKIFVFAECSATISTHFPNPQCHVNMSNVANNASPYLSTFSSKSALSPMFNAYSHYFVGVFVGASVPTANSVCQADGQHFGEQWYAAGIYQSDRGSDTMLLANAQLQFEQCNILMPLFFYISLFACTLSIP